MSSKRFFREARSWIIPAIYAAVAMVAAMTFPRTEAAPRGGELTILTTSRLCCYSFFSNVFLRTVSDF